LGYWVDCLLLDAKDFLPQSRPRLFVLGFHRALDCPLLVRSEAGDALWAGRWEQAIERSPRLRPPRLQARMRQLQLPTGWAAVPLQSPTPAQYRLSDYLDLGDDQAWWDADLVQKHYAMMSPAHRGAVDQWLASGREEVATVYRRIRAGQQRAEVRTDGVAGCLRTPRGGSARQIVLATDRGRLRMRWMSPREYGRLQGVECGLDGQPASRALFGYGDAVCVPVLTWIDQHILSPVFAAAAGRLTPKTEKPALD
jgi:DNA (cytosine-5)-methyltransferase 1